jgi:3',5'-cyclic AMP phosphodiesterase CpdA
MRTIVHLSDIHFGKVNEAILSPLLQTIAALEPDIIVVSGDFTQRATKNQFAAAHQFIKKLPQVTQIFVPGNHDQPLFNLFDRVRDPLKKYRHFITSDTEPGYADDEVMILGINTTRRSRMTDGMINRKQIERIEREFAAAHPKIVKIIVSHHPFDMPEGFPAWRLVARAPLAMQAFAKAGVDVFLAGHFHKKYVGSTASRYKIENHGALVVQSGTSASIRTRNEPPSFNVLSIDASTISVSHHVWNPSTLVFEQSPEEKFIRKENHDWIGADMQA